MLCHLSLKVILYKNNMHIVETFCYFFCVLKSTTFIITYRKPSNIVSLKICQNLYLFIYEILIQFHSYETMLN